MQNLSIHEGQPSTYYYTDREDKIRSAVRLATSTLNSLVKVMATFGLKLDDAGIATLIASEAGMGQLIAVHFDEYIKRLGWMPEAEMFEKRIPFNQLENLNLESRRQLHRHLNECRGLRWAWNNAGTWIEVQELEAYILDACTVIVSDKALNRIQFAQAVADEAGSGWLVTDYLQKDERNQYSVDIEKILKN
jgi:hypothetical protein